MSRRFWGKAFFGEACFNHGFFCDWNGFSAWIEVYAVIFLVGNADAGNSRESKELCDLTPMMAIEDDIR